MSESSEAEQVQPSSAGSAAPASEAWILVNNPSDYNPNKASVFDYGSYVRARLNEWQAVYSGQIVYVWSVPDSAFMGWGLVREGTEMQKPDREAGVHLEMLGGLSTPRSLADPLVGEAPLGNVVVPLDPDKRTVLDRLVIETGNELPEAQSEVLKYRKELRDMWEREPNRGPPEGDPWLEYILGRSRGKAAPTDFPEEAFSASVLNTRDQLISSSEVTAAEIAASLQSSHPGYGGGLFKTMRLHPDTGRTVPVDQWLLEVKNLYDLEQVRTSRHKVIDGVLTLAGLASLDDDLRQDLSTDGFLEALGQDMEIQPGQAELPTAKAGELIFDFSTDAPARVEDVRAEDDKLDIEDDVRTMCRLIVSKNTHPPLAIGLFGDWGTGKTFFMKRMQTRIREMQAEVTSSLDAGESVPYCEEIEQVTFNAWHFVDANLWASLITRIFDVLAGEGQPKPDRQRLFESLVSTQESLKQAREEQKLVSTERRELQSRIDRLEGALKPFKSPMRSSFNVKETLQRIASIERELGEDQEVPDEELTTAIKELKLEALYDLERDARSAWGFARHVPWFLWFWLLMLPALLAVGTVGGLIPREFWSDGWNLMVSVVTALAAWLGPFLMKFRQFLSKAGSAERLVQGLERRQGWLNNCRDQIKSEIETANRRVEDAESRVDEVRHGNRVRQFIREQVTRDAYREQLGVISLIRGDLEKLSSILVTEEEDELGGVTVSRISRLQRIILYIDDLDRCPPDRVVEVLQAVHLLLAFPLFVVVVAVDPRWLLSSLEVYYRKMLHHEDGSNELDEWAATPTDYLEKIFQIPFALSPMSDDGYKSLIEALVPIRRVAPGVLEGQRTQNGTHRDNDKAEDEQDEAGEEIEQDAAVKRVELAAIQAPKKPATPLEVRNLDIPGKPRGLWFAVNGHRMVIATDEGLWLNDRGSTTPRKFAEGPIIECRMSHNLEHLAWRKTEQVWGMDIATGETRWSNTYDNVRVVSPGIQSYDLVIGYEDGLIEWRSHIDGQGTQEARFPSSIRALEVLRRSEDVPLLIARTGGSLFVLAFPELEILEQLEGVDDFAVSEPDEMVIRSGNKLAEYTFGRDGKPLEMASIELPAELRGADARMAIHSSEIWMVAGAAHLHAWRPEGKDQVYQRIDLPIPATNLSLTSGSPVISAWGESGAVVQQRWPREDGPRGPEQLIEAEGFHSVCSSATGVLLATLGPGSCKLWRLGGEAMGEEASQLELKPEERQFLATLGPLVPTARNAKRLVNLYRWLRASRRGREMLVDPESKEYQVVLLILALVVGWPRLALTLLDALDESTADTWQAFLEGLACEREPISSGSNNPGKSRHGPGRLDEDSVDPLAVLRTFSIASPGDIGRYKAWAPMVRRFSILTRPKKPAPQAEKASDEEVLQ